MDTILECETSWRAQDGPRSCGCSRLSVTHGSVRYSMRHEQGNGNGYEKLAQHYGWALGRMFEYLGFKQVRYTWCPLNATYLCVLDWITRPPVQHRYETVESSIITTIRIDCAALATRHSFIWSRGVVFFPWLAYQTWTHCRSSSLRRTWKSRLIFSTTS